MAPALIPDGFVFVPKADGVAAALLDAADKIGADRKSGVRTVHGGYNVQLEIAQRYQEKLEKKAAKAAKVETGPAKPGDPPADVTNPDGSKPPVDENGVPILTSTEDDGTPKEGWTHAQFNDWAAKQEPPVVFPNQANLATKLEVATKPADPADPDKNKE
jgi:hypothetical protein